MSSFKDQLIKLGSTKPELRPHIRPILAAMPEDGRNVQAQTDKLDNALKAKANAALRKAGFDGNGRFRSAGNGISEAFKVLSRFGIEPDQIFDGFFFKQPSGSRPLNIAFTNLEDPYSSVPIRNSVLAFSWQDLGNGKFEVIAYLS